MYKAIFGAIVFGGTRIKLSRSDSKFLLPLYDSLNYCIFKHYMCSLYFGTFKV